MRAPVSRIIFLQRMLGEPKSGPIASEHDAGISCSTVVFAWDDILLGSAAHLLPQHLSRTKTRAMGQDGLTAETPVLPLELDTPYLG